MRTAGRLQGSRVYFAQAHWGGPIKIGYSFMVEQRINTVAGCLPFDLVEIGSFPGYRFQEHFLHCWFAKYRIRGEWFQPVPELWRAAMEARTQGRLTWVPSDMVDSTTLKFKDFPELLSRREIETAELAEALGCTEEYTMQMMRRSDRASLRWIAALCVCLGKSGWDGCFDIEVSSDPFVCAESDNEVAA